MNKKSISHTFYRNEVPESTLRKEKDKGIPVNDHPSVPNGTKGWVGPRRYQSPYEDTKKDVPPAATLDIKAPYNPTSGSGKVIPDRAGFQNKEDIKKFEKRAALFRNITKTLSEKIRDRSKTYKKKIFLVKQRKNFFLFQITKYIVEVKKIKEAERFSESDFKLRCSCPSWIYSGCEYWANKKGFLYGNPKGSLSFPKQRDPNARNLICKHTYSALLYIKRKGL